MPSETSTLTPGLSSYLQSLKSNSASASVDHLVWLLKQRHIRGSQPCAVAATHLFLRIVAELKFDSASALADRVRVVGRRLTAAQPQELVTGNITRRVLGLVREVTEANPDDTPQANGSLKPNQFHPLQDDLTQGDAQTDEPPQITMRDVKEDVLNGLREILDELSQASEQIAAYSLEHIHAHETVLTYTASLTVQRFLLGAARRRKFTVIQVEGYPNEQRVTHDTIVNGRPKTDAEDGDGGASNRLRALTTAGVTVVLVPDSAVFAVMSRVNKVILPSHICLPNGGFISAAGVYSIAKAARAHSVPVVALGAIYKLSPLYPFDIDTVIQAGDDGKDLGIKDTPDGPGIDVISPTSDYVPPDLVDLIITNVGGHAPSYMYRVAADHYWEKDTEI